MNTGNKILGKHIRQFLHKNNKYVLVVQNSVVVVQNNGEGKTKKRAARALFLIKLRWQKNKSLYETV